jgi:riboflavin kinase / FMN adenylyltransferase
MERISGIVIKGKQKGKELGFPTLNLALEGGLGVKSGVYAGTVYFDSKSHKSAIFIGKECNMLEAHMLDFDGDLYDKKVEIEIGVKIRDVIKFENDDALKKQIAADIEMIKNLKI